MCLVASRIFHRHRPRKSKGATLYYAYFGNNERFISFSDSSRFIKPVDGGVVCRMNVFTFFCFFFSFANVLAFPCPIGSAVVTLKTPLGTASGTRDSAGSLRFPVKYGSANRWAPSTVAASWALPYVFPCLFILKAQ